MNSTSGRTNRYLTDNKGAGAIGAGRDTKEGDNDADGLRQLRGSGKRGGGCVGKAYASYAESWQKHLMHPAFPSAAVASGIGSGILGSLHNPVEVLINVPIGAALGAVTGWVGPRLVGPLERAIQYLAPMEPTTTSPRLSNLLHEFLRALPPPVVELIVDYYNREHASATHFYEFNFGGSHLQGRHDPSRPGVVTFEIDDHATPHETAIQRRQRYLNSIGGQGEGINIAVTPDGISVSLNLRLMPPERIPVRLRPLAAEVSRQVRVENWLERHA